MKMSKVIEEVDVICQYKSNGEVIPIKFRFMNEDGIYEEYSVKGYKTIERAESVTTKDGIYVIPKDKIFECKIEVLDVSKVVRLYFSTMQTKWRLVIA